MEVAYLFQTAMSGSIVEWEDTTSIEGSGDGKAIISRNDEEYVVLVEAKNVKVLHSKHDTAKFHRGVAKQKPDFALMISIQEKSIPKMYKLEFIECIPTITIERADAKTLSDCAWIISFTLLNPNAKNAKNAKVLRGFRNIFTSSSRISLTSNCLSKKKLATLKPQGNS